MDGGAVGSGGAGLHYRFHLIEEGKAAVNFGQDSHLFLSGRQNQALGAAISSDELPSQFRCAEIGRAHV